MIHFAQFVCNHGVVSKQIGGDKRNDCKRIKIF